MQPKRTRTSRSRSPRRDTPTGSRTTEPRSTGEDKDIAVATIIPHEDLPPDVEAALTPDVILSPIQEALAEAFRQAVLHSRTRLVAERSLAHAVEKRRGWDSDVDECETAFELASYRVLAAVAPHLIGEVLSGRMTIDGLRRGDWRRYGEAMSAAYRAGGIATDMLPM